MATAKKYIKQIDDIFKSASPEGQKRPDFQWKSVTAAKKNQKIIVGLLDELRKVKQTLHEEMEKIRKDFAGKKVEASRGSNLSGRGGFLMKKGSMSNMQLADLRRQETASLFPYEGVMRRIDEEITALDKTKDEISRWLSENEQQKTEG